MGGRWHQQDLAQLCALENLGEMPFIGMGGRGGFCTLDFLFPGLIHILIQVTLWNGSWNITIHFTKKVSEEKSCTKCTCALNWENLLFKNDALGKTEREAHIFGENRYIFVQI